MILDTFRELDEKMDKSSVQFLRFTPILVVTCILTALSHMMTNDPRYLLCEFIVALGISVYLINPIMLMIFERIADRIKSW